MHCFILHKHDQIDLMLSRVGIFSVHLQELRLSLELCYRGLLEEWSVNAQWGMVIWTL